jgi:hypothetical protein
METPTERGAGQATWFPEPLTPDASVGRPTEPTVAWLSRSTGPKAVAFRQRLNDGLAALPNECRLQLLPSLRADRTRGWHDTFFEFLVARFLQSRGAVVSPAAINSSGKVPDWRGRFHDGEVVVEATAPVINGAVGTALGKAQPLLERLETALPPGWGAGVICLPALTPNDSKQDFDAALRRMFADVPPSRPDSPPVTLQEDLPQGRLELELRPLATGDGRGVWGPGTGYVDDTERRVRQAVTKKRRRRQARDAGAPVLLAVKGFDLEDSFGGFDRALFGQAVAVFDDRRRPVGTRFCHDGEFLVRPDRGAPTFAGVLAFLGAGQLSDPRCVLYLHPRFLGRLPEALLALEVRRFDQQAQRVRVEPQRGAS